MWASRTNAADERSGLALETGYGQHVEITRVDVTRDWTQRWNLDEDWALAGYWDLGLAYWTPHHHSGGNQNVTDAGFTPVFRLVPQAPAAIAPFAEVAVGVHYLSNHEPWRGHQMSTNFQFGDHIGFGASFGPQHAFDLGVRFQHLSNAGIRNPNPGINFYQLRADYHF